MEKYLNTIVDVFKGKIKDNFEKEEKVLRESEYSLFATKIITTAMGTDFEGNCTNCGLTISKKLPFTNFSEINSWAPGPCPRCNKTFTSWVSANSDERMSLEKTVLTAFNLPNGGEAAVYYEVTYDEECEETGKPSAIHVYERNIQYVFYRKDEVTKFYKLNLCNNFEELTSSLANSIVLYLSMVVLEIDNKTEFSNIPITKAPHSLFLTDVWENREPAPKLPSNGAPIAFDIPSVEYKDVVPFTYHITQKSLVNETYETQFYCNRCGHVWESRIERRKNKTVACPHCHFSDEHLLYRVEIGEPLPEQAKRTKISIIDTGNSIDVVSFTCIASTVDLSVNVYPDAAIRIDKKTYNVEKYQYKEDKWVPLAASFRFNATYCFAEDYIISDSLKGSNIDKLTSEMCFTSALLNFIPTYIPLWLKNPVIADVAKYPNLIKEFGRFADLIPVNKECNLNGKDIFEYLGISQKILNIFEKKGWFETYPISFLQKLTSYDKGLSEDSLKWFFSLYSLVKTDDIDKILSFGITSNEIYEYVEKIRLNEFVSPKLAITEWAEYLENCGKLNLDITQEKIRFPDNLLSAANTLSFKIIPMFTEEENDAFDKLVPMYKKLEGATKNITVRLPDSLNEMQKLRRKLGHEGFYFYNRTLGVPACTEAPSLDMVMFVYKNDNPQEPIGAIGVGVDEILWSIEKYATSTIFSLDEVTPTPYSLKTIERIFLQT